MFRRNRPRSDHITLLGDVSSADDAGMMMATLAAAVAAICAGMMMAVMVVMVVVVAMAMKAMVMTAVVVAMVAVLDCGSDSFCRRQLVPKFSTRRTTTFFFYQGGRHSPAHCKGRRPPVYRGWDAECTAPGRPVSAGEDKSFVRDLVSPDQVRWAETWITGEPQPTFPEAILGQPNRIIIGIYVRVA